MISQRELRKFTDSFATGVTVVATQTPDGRLFGLTSRAVASISLEPPLYLVCIDQKSNSLAPIVQAGAFSVNVLRRDQSEIADIFASKRKDKFASVGYVLGELGMPCFHKALAVIECKIIKNIPIADHVILVGLVVASTFSEGEPLILSLGKFV